MPTGEKYEGSLADHQHVHTIHPCLIPCIQQTSSFFRDGTSRVHLLLCTCMHTYLARLLHHDIRTSRVDSSSRNHPYVLTKYVIFHNHREDLIKGGRILGLLALTMPPGIL